MGQQTKIFKAGAIKAVGNQGNGLWKAANSKC